MIMAVLVLALLSARIPVAQAGDDSKAALRRQLEEVQQQLQELQRKVQRMESELNAVPAQPQPQPTTPAAQTTPAIDSQLHSTPPAQPGPGSAPMPSPAAASAADSRPPPAPVQVEAGRFPEPAAVPEAFQWRETIKEQWHNVSVGMSGEEVMQLLGTPSREFTVDGKAVWYYSYPGIGNGSVLFSRDGHTVASWQHPPFGFW